MTANKNLAAMRKVGKMKASMKLVRKYADAYVEALKQEQCSPIPVLSTIVKVQSEMAIRAFVAIPTKYFRPDGTIDKRRQRLGETFIIDAELIKQKEK